MLSAGRQLVELSGETLALRNLFLILLFIAQTPAWPHDYRLWNANCPGAEWNIMCRGCCEYDQIRCKCPAQGTLVGYSVPCCRNAINECDPCIIHPGCSIFENCKRCNNGTWGAKDDFFIKGKYCTECRPGWSGGDCMKCGGVIQKSHGHIVVESYPTNARCEWILQVDPELTVEIRFMMLSLEYDHSCRYDFVEVRDGEDLNSRVIGRYCGNQRPPPIRSSGNFLHILFVSDGYKNFDGFFAIFQEASACSSSPCLHDGTCILDSAHSYRCACLAGYTGRRCENVVMCETPPVPAHGAAEGGHLHLGGRVTFRCDPGFSLQGPRSATCGLNGSWSTPPPLCVPRERTCGVPEKPAHGDHFLVYGPEDVAIAVQYLCYRPYVLRGASQRTCLPNSTWSGTAPTCVTALDPDAGLEKEAEKEKEKEREKEREKDKDADEDMNRVEGKDNERSKGSDGGKDTGKVTVAAGGKDTGKATTAAGGKDVNTAESAEKEKVTDKSPDPGTTKATGKLTDTGGAKDIDKSPDTGGITVTAAGKDTGTAVGKDTGRITVGSKDTGVTVETVRDKDTGVTVETVRDKDTGRGVESTGTGRGSDPGGDKQTGQETEGDNQSISEAERTRCPSPPRLYNGYHTVVLGSGREPDRAEFFCNNSHALSGSAVRTCLLNGTWSGEQPLCIRACREPKVSELVRQRVLPPQVPYRKTPVHKFYSSQSLGKRMGLSSPTMAPAALPPLAPGFHHLYTHIEYQCASPFYHHTGSPRRTCLKTGKWSGRHVSCSPVCGKLPGFESESLAQTRWPWHAAIYRRSPADPASKPDKMAGGLGKAKAGEEEGGEEEDGGAAWQLVCSGALVNQRSVVVAAHCVTQLGKLLPVAPGNIKVVMGKHYRSDDRETKNLQHLRVSSVLVHPNYDPLMLDSDLAVLKLLDKARIGERVLPVCLPLRQGGEVIAQQAYVVGWSILPDARGETGAADAETARAGLIQLGDVVDCEQQYAQQGAPVSITDNMLCGRQHPRGPSNICPGDTGGIALLPPPASFSAPVFSEGQEGGGVVWRLLGVVSHGYEQHGCSPDLYTVYTRTANFKDWIEASMK
ncbi:inactive serine protease PAMR1 isoform X2 [Anguilla anguilla]|uniref:inactive serine protease PAMR1 isoform X2 n=1 Tax=Anguilla anguilla TaxID=7936 RepID=UPI0015AAD647|nr:inactive serine protease PAMR1 isoform X2 [Anguilla anguilla]